MSGMFPDEIEGKGKIMLKRCVSSVLFAGSVLVLSFAFSSLNAHAADQKNPSKPVISEVRLGLSAHGIGSREEGLTNVSGALLFQKVSLGAAPESFLSPRPHIGFSASRKTSAAYAGFTWTYDFAAPVFIELEFGGALNNGTARGSVAKGTNAMGCPLTFREGMNIGYRITPSVSVMLTGEHMSNANLCTGNTGLTNVGLRIGYQF